MLRMLICSGFGIARVYSAMSFNYGAPRRRAHFAGAVPRQRMRDVAELTMPTSFFASLSTGSLRMRFSS